MYPHYAVTFFQLSLAFNPSHHFCTCGNLLTTSVNPNCSMKTPYGK